MKIRIKDWNTFEKENRVGFTRNINISNVVNCFGVVYKKKAIYFLVLIDFYTWKDVMLLRNTSNIEIVDDKLDSDMHFSINKKYQYYDQEENHLFSYDCDWIISKKWIIESNSFLAVLHYSSTYALRLYEENNIEK